jgi:hypothetical protein
MGIQYNPVGNKNHSCNDHFFVSLQISHFFHNFATVINLFAAVYLSKDVVVGCGT